jgi:hypothetical protein
MEKLAQLFPGGFERAPDGRALGGSHFGSRAIFPSGLVGPLLELGPMLRADASMGM